MFNQLHNDVLEFAENYRNHNPTFKYAIRKANRKERLNDGFWFQGTEKYAFLGLINRSGGTNMTKSFGLVFGPNGKDIKCDIEIVFNEEADKKILEFYKVLRDLIGGFQKINESKYKKVLATENGFEAATKFLDESWSKINEIIIEKGLEKILIAESDFEENLERINEFKNNQVLSQNYWLFQGNPKVFDFESAIKADAIKNWTVSAHRDKIKLGDKVILWLTGPESGCYALAEITSQPYERKPSLDDSFYKKEDKSEWQVGIRITHNLIDKPILSRDVTDLATLKTFKAGNQGTNFTSNKSEYETFLKLTQEESNQKRQYWLIAPGEQARMWEEFYNQNIIAIGWHVGNIKQYKTQKEVEYRLESNAEKIKDHGINAQQCFEFGHNINLNDIIIAKKGMSEYLGWGIVTETYSYHAEKEDFQHEINVDWKVKGSWNGEIQQRKTVGNISNNPKINSVIKLLNIPTSLNDHEFINFIKQFDNTKLEFFIQKLRELSSEFGIQYEDSRASYSTRSNRLNFIVGQRLCFCLETKKGKTEFRYISSTKLPTFDVSFDGPPTAFLNRTENISEVINHEETLKEAIAKELARTKYSGYISSENKEFRSYVFDRPFEATNLRNKMLHYPLNTILYGPPGTGKTYESVLMTAEIVKNQSVASYTEAKQIFNENLHDRIEFITFHQNYSYEDFIQGIRPDVENNKSLTFEKKDGIFKIIADRALQNLLTSEKLTEPKKSFEAVFEEFFKPMIEGDVEEIEVKMKKVSFFITEIGNRSIDFRKASGGSAHTLSIATLKKMYEAGTVLDIQGLSSYYRPLLEKLLDLGKISDNQVEKVSKNNYVIVIDEINRANISRVFGELITLIEPDKRSHGAIPLMAKLPSGDTFVVPSNLYIIGTMNTADKSIALLDIALRRRFEFISMYPKYEINGFEIFDVDILRSLNEQIISSKGHDFQIGHSYFMKDNNDLVQRMNNKVIPLLLEYYMNDDKEVKNILYKAGLEVVPDSWPIRINGRRG